MIDRGPADASPPALFLSASRRRRSRGGTREPRRRTRLRRGIRARRATTAALRPAPDILRRVTARARVEVPLALPRSVREAEERARAAVRALDGGVVALSGGTDSALVLALAAAEW